MAEAPKKAKQGKKNRKVGRNAIRCKAYALAHRREHNKVRRLEKHLRRLPADKCARACLTGLYSLLGIRKEAA